jgi:hypothetical protein
MKKRLSYSMFLVALMLLASDSGSPRQRHPHLTLCDIVASPKRYGGNEVTVRATYRVAFEASQLYCLSCIKSGGVWAEFENSDAGSKAAANVRNRVHSLGTLNGTFTGVFQYGERYGQMGAYRFRFTIRRVARLETIDHVGLPPETMANNSLSRVCQ